MSDLARTIVEFLCRRFANDGVQAIYLFGSVASGHEHPASDVDVGILVRKPLDPVVLFDAAQDLAVELGRDVDLVDLRRASTVLQVQVISTGTRLLRADPLGTDEFEMYAFSDYARLNEERRGAVEALKDRYRDV